MAIADHIILLVFLFTMRNPQYPLLSQAQQMIRLQLRQRIMKHETPRYCC
jgi:hypothetical protein